MSQATKDLVNEHEAILSALQILERMSNQAKKEKAISVQDIHEFTSFLQEFADKCHHGKEEGLLFPAMIKAGFEEQNGPIGIMLQEHTQGRALIRKMSDAATAEVNIVQFTETAREYIDLMRIHIAKENSVLFPMADKVLSNQKLAQLFEEFEAHEENVIGHGRHEELHGVLHRLDEKYS